MQVKLKIPSDVQIEVQGGEVSVKGAKGELKREFLDHPLFKKEVKIEKSGEEFVVSCSSEKKKIKAMVGTVAAHVRNMMKGVKDGYNAKLKIIYVHFPMTVKITGEDVLISNFLGERVPRKAKIPIGCKIDIKGDEIHVSGIDKDKIGFICKTIEETTRVKARDRRVFGDGIFIQEKPR